MEVWCLKHLVYKHMCMCIYCKIHACMLFTCMYILPRFAAFVRKHSYIAVNEYPFCGWVWSLLCMHSVLCFVRTWTYIEQMQSCQSQNYWTVYTTLLAMFGTMATKHSKKCQSCSSNWLIILLWVLVSSTLHAVHWFVYDYIQFGFDCAHHAHCG